jgi:NADH-quinone oxidoreductase subunit M
MILAFFVFWFMLAGLAAWLAGRWGDVWPRRISLIAVGVHLIGLLATWGQYLGGGAVSGQGAWIVQVSVPWIPQLGISFSLGMDGVSLLLVLLLDILGLMAVAASWEGIQVRVGFFHLNLLWILGAIAGVFLSLDLFLFYFFWELMLVPLYFLIGIWGHENRVYATLKFFIFTQAGSLFMLLSILGLYIVHGQSSGVYTFEYTQLLGTPVAPATAFWLMLGFFVAFAVKLPAFPFHTWLPDAHTEAPTAGSIALAGLVLKAGGYGFLRFLVPLFPGAAVAFAPVAMALGVVGILYGAVVAFGQTDLKRLVAYTSVSHMGFVLLGIFAWNQLALQGALMVMLAHGISTSALFILAGDLQDRMHTRDLNRMGGLWSTVPRMGGSVLFFALASMGLPGLANFVGEFLVLLGIYQVSVPLAVLATLGFIISTVYALWMIQRVFWGSNQAGWQLRDSTPRELAIMGVMMAVAIWWGLFPQPLLDTARPALEALQKSAAVSPQAALPDPNARAGSFDGGKP